MLCQAAQANAKVAHVYTCCSFPVAFLKYPEEGNLVESGSKLLSEAGVAKGQVTLLVGEPIFPLSTHPMTTSCLHMLLPR